MYLGDCRDVLPEMPDASVDAVVTDPPYDLTAGKKGGSGAASVNLDSPYGRSRIGTGNGGFMGKDWDATGVAFDPETWRQALRVLKPGGHLLAFGGTRTYHRLAVAIEDAGFEIRDCITWLYGSGFPKSLDVSKAIDKAAGAERSGGAREWAGGARSAGIMGNNEGTQAPTIYDTPATPEAERWRGWGTALKPASEPIIVARKSLVGTVIANVQAYGTGALNVDGCRVDSDRPETPYTVTRWKPGATLNAEGGTWKRNDDDAPTVDGVMPSGRWPTNVVLDDEAAAALDEQTGTLKSGLFKGHRNGDKFRTAYGTFKGDEASEVETYGDEGGASRFYPVFRYEAKAGDDERPRVGNVAHPTVKPVALMRWLVRLVTPPEGVVLDPFLGSGTTAEACVGEGLRCIGIEREEDYMALIEARLGKGIQIGLGL